MLSIEASSERNTRNMNLLLRALEDLNQRPAPWFALGLVLIPLGIVAALDVYFAWRDGDRYRGGFVWAPREQADQDAPEATVPGSS
jgi:hypothetical protein